jgi:TolB protein
VEGPLFDDSVQDFRWSPDGTRVAFRSSSGVGEGVYVAAYTPGAPGTLAPRSTWVDVSNDPIMWHGTPSWSPDGQWLEFSKRASKTAPVSAIWRAHPDGTQRQALLTDGADNDGADWTR